MANQQNELQAKPSQTKELIQVISPEWRKMKAKVDNTQKKYEDLINQKSFAKYRINSLEKGFNLGFLGVFLASGIIGVIFWLWRLQSSVKLPLKAFLLPLLTLVKPVLGVIFIVCSYFGKQHNKMNKGVQKEIQQHQKTIDSINNGMLEQAYEVLVELKSELVETPEFESEVIKITNTQLGLVA